MAFQFASANLLLELGVVLWVMLGWRFTAATLVGGIVMITILSVLLRLFMRKSLIRWIEACYDCAQTCIVCVVIRASWCGRKSRLLGFWQPCRSNRAAKSSRLG